MVSGSAGTSVTLRYTTSGSLHLGGTGGPYTSPWFQYVGNGGMTLGGEMDGFDNFFDITGASIGVDTSIDLLEFEAQPILTLPDGQTSFSIDNETVVTDCGCKELGLTVFMKHNFGDGNLLSEFLFRNGLALPPEIDLLYRKSETSWFRSFHYKGVGRESQREQWDLLFEWGCTTNIGGEDLDIPSWKFSFFAKRKNLITGEDSTSRILFTFPKEAPCQDGDKYSFEFKLNTQTRDITTTGDVYVGTFIFFDEIGLFEGTQWIETNPILDVIINELSTSENFKRLSLSSIVPQRSLLLIN